MRKALILTVTALIAFLPASHLWAQSFDGPFVGVHVGGQQTDIRNLDTGPGTQVFEAERQSFTGGLFAGYDRQVAPRIVLGGEAGVDLASDDAVAAIDPEWSLDLTGRVVAFLVILPIVLSFALRAVTGDQMSAVGLGLIIFVTVAAWFGGHPVSTSPNATRK